MFSINLATLTAGLLSRFSKKNSTKKIFPIVCECWDYWNHLKSNEPKNWSLFGMIHSTKSWKRLTQRTYCFECFTWTIQSGWMHLMLFSTLLLNSAPETRLIKLKKWTNHDFKDWLIRRLPFLLAFPIWSNKNILACWKFPCECCVRIPSSCGTCIYYLLFFIVTETIVFRCSLVSGDPIFPLSSNLGTAICCNAM